MSNIQKLNIILLDINKDMCKQWKEYFRGFENISIINDDLCNFLKHNKVECVVSPANSFGIMDGGFDLAITNWYGGDLMKLIQSKIGKEYLGEQPVGTSLIVKTNKTPEFVIHTPTMRIPKIITDYEVIYHCMRNALILALKNNINSIVIPAFGAATGYVPTSTVAYMMSRAYLQILAHQGEVIN